MKIWQPAFSQAMQRHGGRTRPLVPASALPVVVPSHVSANDENRADDKTEDPASTASAETKE